MIIDPSFTTHWKVQSLIKALNDKAAPVYLLNLWGHCQTQKRDLIPKDPIIVAAICKFSGNENVLIELLLRLHFLEESTGNSEAEIDEYKVHDFTIWNATLVSKWRNGGSHCRRARLSDKRTKKTAIDDHRNTDSVSIDDHRNTDSVSIDDHRKHDSVPDRIRLEEREREEGVDDEFWDGLRAFHGELLKTEKFPNLTVEGLFMVVRMFDRRVLRSAAEVVEEARCMPDHVLGSPLPWLKKRLSNLEMKIRGSEAQVVVSGKGGETMKKKVPVQVPDEWGK